VASSARVSPARATAFDVLLRVATQDSYAAELLHSNLLASLSNADRGLATELVMGVLRWQQKLDQILEAAAGKSIAKFDAEVKVALHVGAYQLLYLDRIPARAAVNESVELVKQHGKRSAAPLINAILRKLSKKTLDSFQQKQPGSDLATTYSHPAWLVERWTKFYGEESTRAICEHNQKRPQTTIRVTSPAVIEELSREGISLQPATMVHAAWHVTSGDVTQTRAYHERRLALQDEASQLVALLAQGKTILDCCASPGGKSAIAAERNPSALVVSMDLHLHRVRLMRKLTGLPSVLAADARHLPFNHRFDCIMADLPCTGTGTLARNPEIKWRLKPEDVPRLGKLQLEVLRSVAALAKTIVYSTCSLEPEEGEDVISRFLAEHAAFRPISVKSRLQQLSDEGSIRADTVSALVKGDFLRTVPGIKPCDGFFAAILEST
jgi:16S rRNA (cytosine967-C5)-methyltransferase